MWVKQCHKPPMTGNGFNPTDKNGDDWGLVYYCFTHIRWDDLLWEYHQIIPRVYDPWHDLGVPWLPHWSLPFLGDGWMGYPCVPKQRKLNGSITGWWFQPLWKILVSWDDYSQYMGKNVPNQQPDKNNNRLLIISILPCWWFSLLTPSPNIQHLLRTTVSRGVHIRGEWLYIIYTATWGQSRATTQWGYTGYTMGYNMEI